MLKGQDLKKAKGTRLKKLKRQAKGTKLKSYREKLKGRAQKG